ncbi:MAG: fimbrillin family protein [Phocaeicola sp.]
MNKINLVGVYFLSWLLLSCMDKTAYDTGFYEFFPEESTAPLSLSLGAVRSIAQWGTLPVGSDVLVNATGALSATNECYRWSGAAWEGKQWLVWDRDSVTATFLALYPFHANYSYTSEELYSDGHLVDLLYDYQELSYQQEINPTFKHRFSQISIAVNGAMQQKLTSLKVTVPCTILSLSTLTSELACSRHLSQTVTVEPNQEGLYQLIVPPVDSLELTLSVTCGEELYTYQLGATHFKSNHHYSYSLKYASDRVGIQTVDDFIAFGKLINGEPYAGEKSLADFGETVDGVTTYYLLNDLEFAPEDSLRLSTIGHYTHFNDRFEGNNHTLRGLRLQRLRNGYALFAQVGPKGIVRNLHVADSHIQGSYKSYLVSFIVAYNEGVVDHCSVTNSIASVPAISTGGVVVGTSIGTVLNCWSWNCILDFQTSSSIGGIVAVSNGHIYNCFAGNLTFRSRTGSTYGGICFSMESNAVGSIQNCYFYHTQSQSVALGGVVYSTPRSGNLTLRYCFTNYRNWVSDNGGAISFAYNYFFSSSFLYKKGDDSWHVVDGLNEWVSGVGAGLSDYTFKRWEADGDGIPRFAVE